MKLLSFLFFVIFTDHCFSAMSTIGKTVKVDVPGMVCQMCVQGMKKNFSSLVNNPEEDVLVDLDNKTVTVKFNSEVTEELIKEKIQDAGYNANVIIWLDDQKK